MVDGCCQCFSSCLCACLQAGWTADDQTIFDHLWGRAAEGSSPAITAPSILVWNKVDLTTPHPPLPAPSSLPQQPVTSRVMAATPSASITPNAAGEQSNMHNQAVANERSVHTTEAGDAAAKPSSSSPSSPPSFSASSLRDSQLPLQPSPSTQSQVAALELPSSCVGCFSACVETCATTGLGLDALNTALLDLAQAPSLASGGLCMPSVVLVRI